MITWTQQDVYLYPNRWIGVSDKFVYYTGEFGGDYYGWTHDPGTNVSRKLKSVEGAKRWCVRHYMRKKKEVL